MINWQYRQFHEPIDYTKVTAWLNRIQAQDAIVRHGVDALNVLALTQAEPTPAEPSNTVTQPERMKTLDELIDQMQAQRRERAHY